MTSEIEQEFYKVFEISPATVQEYGATYFWDTIEIDGKRYTPIDDHKLLELICILNKEGIYGYSDWGGNFVIGETVEELKESILTDCIRDKSKVFKQIRQLFKEDNNVLMSEIEKMYENARVKQERMCEWLCKDSDLCSQNCEHYGSTQLHYPPFTAEKQIAILCWLVNLNGNVTFNNKSKDITPEKLQDALAWAVNQYWIELTLEQQQQVKGILE